MKVTKYFSFNFFFLSSTFDCLSSIGDLGCRKILSFMRNPFVYKLDPEIERSFHEKRKKQRVERLRRKS